VADFATLLRDHVTLLIAHFPMSSTGAASTPGTVIHRDDWLFRASGDSGTSLT
jgi:hypothetical protein